MSRNESLLADWRARALALEVAVGRAVIGQERVIRLIDVAVFARGHVLLEGDVGVGKTTLLRAFARGIGGAFERIEGTVDMMPSDLVYYTYVGEDGRPRVDPGPLLRHGADLSVFFFNEINRARPQVQSLLLRTMAERSVSAFNRQYRFPHLIVFADRNRVEKEETFELASAARDRFLFELQIETPTQRSIQTALVFDPLYHDADALVERVPEALLSHLELNQVAGAIQEEVRASETLHHYALELWRATREPAAFGIEVDGVDMERLVLAGASPRGMSMLLRAARVAAWLDGRDFLTPEDLRAVFGEAIGHRVFFTPVYEMRRSQIAPRLMRQVLDRVAAP
ncbi:MAG: putative MoxR protein [Proteobacteria bacterium]|nr:putative MoxR protein [Pseudomonadota bacterium]